MKPVRLLAFVLQIIKKKNQKQPLQITGGVLELGAGLLHDYSEMLRKSRSAGCKRSPGAGGEL